MHFWLWFRLELETPARQVFTVRTVPTSATKTRATRSTGSRNTVRP